MSITITVDVRAADAVRAGKAQSGRLTVDLAQADLDALSPAQREQLANVLASGSPILWRAIESSVPEVVRLLDLGIATRAQAQAREAAEQRERETEYCAAAERVVAERETCGRAPSLRISWPYAGQGSDSRQQIYLEIAARPEVVAWQAEIDAANEAERLAQQARDADRAAAEAEAEKLDAAAKARYVEAAAELVRTVGTADQVARLAAGVLPVAERDALVHDVAFAPLAARARYERLTKADAPHADDCEGADKISFRAEAEDDGVTADQWAQIEILRELMPAAEIHVRWHHVVCEAEYCPVGLRWSALVTVQWHGRALTREYALPPGVCAAGHRAV